MCGLEDGVVGGGNFFGNPAIHIHGPIGFASPGYPDFALIGNYENIFRRYFNVKNIAVKISNDWAWGQIR